MKTRGWLVAVILFPLLTPFKGRSQCGTIRTVSYDTTVTGFGSTGGVPFTFTFPQFNSTLGTLTEVQLTSQVTLAFNYNIENELNVFRNHRLRLERADVITSSLLSEPLEMSYISPWRNHNLQASDGITGSGPDFMSVPPFYLVNDYTIIDATYYNTADFMGGSTVSFDYNTSMYRTSDPATGALITNAASNDEITFTITYTYCDNLVMSPVPRPTLTPGETEQIKNRLFPNPSRNGNFSVQFHNQKRDDWRVEVYTTSGQLLSSKRFFNASKAEINDLNLKKGVYLVRSINTKSQENFVERLIIK